MYYNQNTLVFLNGNWVKASEATAGIYSQTLHYGTGVFEGIRSYDTEDGVQIFKAREHYERLIYSAEKMFIKINYSVEELVRLTYQLLEKNNLKDAYIRPLVYLGEGMSLQSKPSVNVMLCAWEWEQYLGHKLLNVMTSPFQRPNPKSCFVDAKVVGHYTNSVLATLDAKNKGFDEALLLDSNFKVAEGPGANFFMEKNGVVYTPPKGNILPGITRATMFELADELGVKIEEKYFSIEEVYDADGAFFTGTAAEVAGIDSVDSIRLRFKWEDTIGYELARKYKIRVAVKEFRNFELV